MGALTKVDGIWESATAPYVKVSETWKIAKSAWTKIDEKWKSWFLQGGILDSPIQDQTIAGYPNFTANILNSLNNSITDIAIQPDGKIIVVGNFTFYTFLGATSELGRIARFNEDGTLDQNFNTSAAIANGTVSSVIVQPDGKIIIGGQFTIVGNVFNNVIANRIARLNADGTRDNSFITNTGNGFNELLTSMAIQPDGKIIVAGNFTNFNGVTTNRIARLNSNGSIDSDFTANTGTAAGSTVNKLAIQSDGKIVIGGFFTTFNGTAVNRIARLDSNGTLDTEFINNIGTGFDNVPFAIGIQSDGKIVIGGIFGSLNSISAPRIIRLNTNGTRDTEFTNNIGTGANATVQSLAIQSDGKIVIGGQFTTFNGVTVNRIARLNLDGTRDTSFTANTGSGFPTGSVNSISIQSNGKIFLGGTFVSFDSIGTGRIIRLFENGVLDPIPGPSNRVNSIAIQPDGKILVVGQFKFFNSITVNRIVRLNLDGSIDTVFAANIGTGANNNIGSVIVQLDGKILLSGNFTNFNGVAINRIVRLNSDGTIDTAFSTNVGNGFLNNVFTMKIQQDQKIIISGIDTTFNGATINRIVRLNTNGTRDTDFTNNLGTGLSGPASLILIQPDGKIILGGDFTTVNSTDCVRIVRLNLDGTLDTAFNANTGTGFNATVLAGTIQPDGKIIVAGNFTNFNGVTRNRILRLNSDGTLDTVFSTNVGAGANNTVDSVVIQPNNNIIVAGNFTNFNGFTVGRLVRLSSNGIRDIPFNTNIFLGTGVSGISAASIYSVIIQPDQKIIIAGQFTSFGGKSNFNIARIGGELAE
jgi:uncharacterized delta-60 repeat protein